MKRYFEAEREELIEWSEQLYESNQTNLQEIREKFDPSNEFHKYFFGIISRQIHLLADMNCLLKYNFHHFYSGIFIIGRSLLDDYIQLFYVMESENKNKTIVEINGDAHGKSMKKIQELLEINKTVFNEAFPYYPTTASLEKLKESLLAQPEKAKYIKDKSKWKFLRFPSKAELVRSFAGKPANADLARIYFLWRYFSDYIHYSKFTYDYENQHHEDKSVINFTKEIIIYTYKSSKLACSYFEKELDFSFKPIKFFDEMDIEFLTHI